MTLTLRIPAMSQTLRCHLCCVAGNFRLDAASGILYPAKPLRSNHPGQPADPAPAYSLTVLATDRNGTGTNWGITIYSLKFEYYIA